MYVQEEGETGVEIRDRKQPEQTQISCQNSFTGLHSSILSRDSGKPASILSGNLIDPFDGPELSQQVALLV